MNEEFRAYTRNELLINWRNQVADAVVKSEINLKFHIQQSKLIDKKKAEYKVAEMQIRKTEQVVSQNRAKLELIDEAIKSELKGTIKLSEI